MGAVPSVLADMTWHVRDIPMMGHWTWWIFWLLIVGLVLMAFWRGAEEREARTSKDPVEDALRQRFVRGELSEREFREALRLLHGG